MPHRYSVITERYIIAVVNNQNGLRTCPLGRLPGTVAQGAPDASVQTCFRLFLNIVNFDAL